MANKRKTTTAIVAGVTAVALLLGGTFAWTSISQQAKNETAGIVNVGGRLHDDFNGTNKDVYVENFTDPYNGGQPIYARVKLTEYMEVGKEAGQADNPDRSAVPVVVGTNINDESTWTPHVPSTSCAVCATEGTCKIHDHWTWNMGGDNGTTGSTIFMPTFNKDKDSLAADINGTYHGTVDTDKVYYDDYVVYTTDSANGGNNVAEADKEAYEGEIYSIVGTEIYDDDTDTLDNGGTRQEANKTHTAKATSTASVMTMAEWQAAGSQPGNYWVYDTDGWAYWANPIMPGEATGLLLDGINMTKNPGEKCYYAINVVAQFSTVGDWKDFYTDEDNKDYDVSPEAEAVLNAAAQNVATVTVTNVSGETLVNRGAEVKFSATTTVGAVSAAATDEYDWVVLNEDLTESETSTITAGADGTATLKVGAAEMSDSLYVAARSKSTGAVGMSAVAVQLYTVTVTAQDGATTVKSGQTLTFNATVVNNNTNEEETSGVTWEVIGGNGNSTIDENGVLTVDANEAPRAELTITATSKNGGFIGKTTVTIADEYTIDVTAASSNVDVGNTLTLSAAVTKNGETDTSGVTWSVNSTVGSTIDDGGVLTISVNEPHDTKLTVTATSVADKEVYDTYEVTIYNGYDYLNTVAIGTTQKVRIDNTEWYVLARDEEKDKVLIWSADIIPNVSMSFGSSNIWRDSAVRTYLNDEYFNSLNVLRDYVVPTTLNTSNNSDRTVADLEYIETTDNVFLLSEADFDGSYEYGKQLEEIEYTLGKSGIIVSDGMRESSRNSFLRSPRGSSAGVANLYDSGTIYGYPAKDVSQLRPAMWVDLSE